MGRIESKIIYRWHYLLSLTFVLIVCVFILLAILSINHHRNLNNAVEKISDLNGVVKVNNLFGVRPVWGGVYIPGSGIVEISIQNPYLTSKDIEFIQDIDSLRAIDFQQTQVDDAVFDLIGRFKSLERLNLEGTDVTTQGLIQYQNDQRNVNILPDPSLLRRMQEINLAE